MTPFEALADPGTCEKHELCRAANGKARRWMRRMVQCGEFRESSTGEPQYTPLAEAAAFAYDHDEWLDDEDHPVWQWAIEAFTEEGP